MIQGRLHRESGGTGDTIATDSGSSIITSSFVTLVKNKIMVCVEVSIATDLYFIYESRFGIRSES
jgi:hypothetical protein